GRLLIPLQYRFRFLPKGKLLLMVWRENLRARSLFLFYTEYVYRNVQQNRGIGGYALAAQLLF
ncbi:Bgt-20653-2, partial [Blumeria graminis f. sp. tritici]